MQTTFFADKFVNTAKQRLENNIANSVEYFESHSLNLNEDKAEKFPKQAYKKSQITSEK